MFLVGGKMDPQAFGPKLPEILEQPVIHTRVLSEPISDELIAVM
jgi:hypothetical protein